MYNCRFWTIFLKKEAFWKKLTNSFLKGIKKYLCDSINRNLSSDCRLIKQNWETLLLDPVMVRRQDFGNKTLLHNRVVREWTFQNTWHLIYTFSYNTYNPIEALFVHLWMDTSVSRVHGMCVYMYLNKKGAITTKATHWMFLCRSMSLAKVLAITTFVGRFAGGLWYVKSYQRHFSSMPQILVKCWRIKQYSRERNSPANIFLKSLSYTEDLDLRPPNRTWQICII